MYILNILLLSTAAVVSAQNACIRCDDIHFFLARGNNEPYPGRQAMLVDATCDGLTGCGYEDLYYSSLYTDLYCQDAYEGVLAGHAQMTAYAQECPDSKLIIAGYSQGMFDASTQTMTGKADMSIRWPDHDRYPRWRWRLAFPWLYTARSRCSRIQRWRQDRSSHDLLGCATRRKPTLQLREWLCYRRLLPTNWSLAGATRKVRTYHAQLVHHR
jgi:hypothetical protein